MISLIGLNKLNRLSKLLKDGNSFEEAMEIIKNENE